MRRDAGLGRSFSMGSMSTGSMSTGSMSTGSMSMGYAVALVLLGLAVGGCASGRCGTASPSCEPCAAAPANPCSPCGPMPTAVPGEAWCCVWVPPVMGTATCQVCVCPEKKLTHWVPPVYGTRPRLVCIAPAKLEEKVTPGLWATRQEDVLLCPEREGWKKTCCPPADLAPGEVQCECAVKCVTPAVWGKECTRVCVAPDRRCVAFTPAQYKCVEERYLVDEGFCEECTLPATFEDRVHEVVVTPGRWEWRRNKTCEVPFMLPALEVEMKDSAEGGAEEGMFAVGTIARYDLIVKSDVGSQKMPPLQVFFTLPPEMEFVSGEGDEGITVTGAGQAAQSTVFQLGVDGVANVHILAKVLATPKMNMLQVRASIRNDAGEQLAEESESSTIK